MACLDHLRREQGAPDCHGTAEMREVLTIPGTQRQRSRILCVQYRIVMNADRGETDTPASSRGTSQYTKNGRCVPSSSKLVNSRPVIVVTGLMRLAYTVSWWRRSRSNIIFNVQRSGVLGAHPLHEPRSRRHVSLNFSQQRPLGSARSQTSIAASVRQYIQPLE